MSEKDQRRLSSVSVTVLGAGDAFGSHGRFQATYLISTPEMNILMDAGPTLLPSLKRNGLKPSDIDLILISHLHGDHFNGLGYLILEYLYESKPRAGTVTIAGPRGLEKRTYDLCRAIYKEGGIEDAGPPITFQVLKPNSIHQLHGIAVKTIRTPHTKKDISLGFRIELNGKTIAFTGDSGWTEELFDLSDGADLFLCECTYFETNMDFHLSYPAIAENRDRFKARRLVLTHLGREVLDRIDEVKLETARDGMRIEL